MQPPARYGSFCGYDSPDLIKDHIFSATPVPITRIKKEDIQSQINEENVLRNGSTKATQWAFVRHPSALRLGEVMRGKIHIDITAAAAVQEK
jgi:hypothetical protein